MSAPILFSILLLLFIGFLADSALRAPGRRDARTRAGLDDRGGEIGHLWVRGRARHYYLHLPQPTVKGPVPLVLAFHGGHGSGVTMSSATGLNAVADLNGFAVVYPDAVEQWNDGRRTTQRRPDDLRFIRKLLRHLKKKHALDADRIYATGTSSGGMFTLRLACELTDELAAVAAVNASFPSSYPRRCASDRAMPILLIRGTADPLLPWAGGKVQAGRRMGAGGNVLPTKETVMFWVRHNGCAETPLGQVLPSHSELDPTRVKSFTYPDGRDGARVVLLRVEGGGHTWPGSSLRLGPRIAAQVGLTNFDIDASVEIWRFFADFSLQGVRSGSAVTRARQAADAPTP